jgi:uncharacterized cysteine cluster protein YcgN (CxxCxxCC family)
MTQILKCDAEGNRVPLSADELAGLAAMRGNRSCDGCSMCCKLPEITEPELTKPLGKWCTHCSPASSRGCKIYDRRPAICASYHCGFLMWRNVVPDHWKPSICKMIVNADERNPLVKVLVDPTVKGRWREQPYLSDLATMQDHFSDHGVELWVDEMDNKGVWHFGARFVTFVPAGDMMVAIAKKVCPMPPDDAMQFTKPEVDAETKWKLWQQHWPRRRFLALKTVK